MKWQNIFKNKSVRIVLVLITLMIVLFVVCDNIIMPLYTRHGQELSVPDVTLMSFDAAKKILTASGFKLIKSGTKYDNQYPRGYVLFQSPEAGAVVKHGRRIYVTVCKGKRMIEMPKLTGISERDALFLAESMDLSVDEIDYDYSSYYLSGTISAQSIPEKELVPAGSRINLTISLGRRPDEFYVPDVVGKSLKDAKVVIKKAGLVLGQVNTQVTKELLPNTVIKQSINPDTQVMQGDTLNIFISVYPKSNEHDGNW